MPNTTIEQFDPTQEAKIRQQRALAERLGQIGAARPTQIVRGGKYEFAVPQSGLEHVSNALATGLGAYQSGQADRAEQDMERKRQELLAEALGNMQNGNSDAAYQIMMQDPRLAGQALEMYRRDMERQQDLQRNDFEFEREADLKRELKQMGGNGGFSIDPETGAITYNKPMNQGQGKANLYASRMAESDKIIQNVGNIGTDLGQRQMSGVPLIGNYLVSDEYQQLDQAERDFVNATLRQESGAVINPDEFDNARKQYFPQPGDKPDVIAQKARNRALAIQKMYEQTGRPAPDMSQGGGNMQDFQAQYDAMPSGTVFIAPDGTTRRKP